jgi:hypothetical protein
MHFMAFGNISALSPLSVDIVSDLSLGKAFEI